MDLKLIHQNFLYLDDLKFLKLFLVNNFPDNNAIFEKEYFYNLLSLQGFHIFYPNID